MAEAHGQRYKALLDVAGRPMIQHVFAALKDCGQVGQVTVYTQEPEHLNQAVLTADTGVMDVRVEPSAVSISETVLGHMDRYPDQLPLLVTTADNPMLSAEALSEFLSEGASGHDLSVGVVSKQAVDKLPVHTQRTWLKFRDGSVTGCNLFLMQNARVKALVIFWRSLEQQRKKVNHLARKLGLLFLIRYRLGWLSLPGAFSHISDRFGLSAGAVVLSDGRLAIDADHQADLEAIRTLKQGQGASSG